MIRWWLWEWSPKTVLFYLETISKAQRLDLSRMPISMKVGTQGDDFVDGRNKQCPIDFANVHLRDLHDIVYTKTYLEIEWPRCSVYIKPILQDML